MEKTVLPLPHERGSNLFIYKDRLNNISEDIETFLDGEHYLCSRDFSKHVLFNHEVQSNNNVEGYYDDVDIVNQVIRNISTNVEPKKRQRIMNLYLGYKYILSHNDINENNLKKLYDILSNNLLEQEDLDNMGIHYRNNPVYIHYSSNPDVEPDTGVSSENVKEYMDSLFEFINNPIFHNNVTDEFIKSQIIHFYFVYIHPYYDVNGRTARTLSLWYLLNMQNFPFVIFNRAIQIAKSEYYLVIRESKKFHNMTYFVKYMMENVLTELEKEYIMHGISETTNDKLTSTDYQTMHILLSMNQKLTLLDFASSYNNRNTKKTVKQIEDTMINPLLEKGILVRGRYTTKMIRENTYNFELMFNRSRINDTKKVKRLSLF